MLSLLNFWGLLLSSGVTDFFNIHFEFVRISSFEKNTQRKSFQQYKHSQIKIQNCNSFYCKLKGYFEDDVL